MGSTAKKRRQFSTEMKLQILIAVDKGRKKCDVARSFGIPPSTLSTILGQREEIEKAALLGPNRKRSRACRSEELDKEVYDWLMQARAMNIPISGPILQQQAHEMSLQLEMENFCASNGWLQKFKKRWNLSTLKMAGEAAAVDPALQEDWKSKLSTLTEGYNPKDIFNADEAGIFYNMLPDKTLALRGESCHGGKRSKDRFTVLLCANSDGTEKVSPLIIGKYAKPRCFKNVTQLPCQYKNTNKAWMTSSLFKEWLCSIDAQMVAQNRKIILFLDRCTAHVTEGFNLRNTKVVLFPPNCTSTLQPMDQGVISQVKRNFRRQLVQFLLRNMHSGIDVLKWNILQSIQRLCLAWDEVTSSSIANCFRKAGFSVNTEIQEEDHDSQIETEWGEVAQGMNVEGVSFDDFVEADTGLTTCEVYSERVEEPEAEDPENELDPDIELTRPKRHDVYAALNVLETFFFTSEGCKDNLKVFRAVERTVLTELNRQSKQMKLTDYFQQKKID